MNRIILIVLVGLVGYFFGYIQGRHHGHNLASEFIIGNGNLSGFKSKSDIIGTPFKVGKLEITENSVWGNYKDVLFALNFLGNDWRIASVKELNFISKNRHIVNNLHNSSYWCSDVNPKDRNENFQFDFGTGKVRCVFNGYHTLWFMGATHETQYAIFVRDAE